MPAGKAAVVVAGLIAGAGIGLWSALTDRPLSIVGATLPPWCGLILGGLGLVLAAHFGFQAVARRPFLVVGDEGLLWRRFPLPKRLRWQDVTAIEPPESHSMGFGSRYSTIAFVCGPGERLNLWIGPELAHDVYEQSVDRWRRARS